MERRGSLTVPEIITEGGVRPQTFAQHLKEGAVNFVKNAAGVWIRLGSYVTGGTAVGLLMWKAGIPDEVALPSTVGVMIGAMLVSEIYLMPKLEKRLPWLKTHRKIW